jgi:hypothetical protein
MSVVFACLIGPPSYDFFVPPPYTGRCRLMLEPVEVQRRERRRQRDRSVPAPRRAHGVVGPSPNLLDPPFATIAAARCRRRRRPCLYTSRRTERGRVICPSNLTARGRPSLSRVARRHKDGSIWGRDLWGRIVRRAMMPACTGRPHAGYEDPKDPYAVVGKGKTSDARAGLSPAGLRRGGMPARMSASARPWIERELPPRWR